MEKVDFRHTPSSTTRGSSGQPAGESLDKAAARRAQTGDAGAAQGTVEQPETGAARGTAFQRGNEATDRYHGMNGRGRLAECEVDRHRDGKGQSAWNRRRTFAHAHSLAAHSTNAAVVTSSQVAP